MNHDLYAFFQGLLLRVPVILVALTIHEWAHGQTAFLLGDPTADRAGRRSFNPLVHLDPFGTLMLLFGPFGWARPVPVNPGLLRSPRRDTVLVSLAGPASNILLALVSAWIIRLSPQPLVQPLGTMLALSFVINIGLSFFNLLPVPPLDGSGILLNLVPPVHARRVERYLRWAPNIFFLLIIVEWALNIPVFSSLFYPVFRPYLSFWQIVAFGGKVLSL